MPDFEENWHNRLLCQHLDQWAAGEILRLMVFMPPRSGKSELVSRRLPAYLLGKNPDTTIITASYGSELARRMNRDVQRIIDDPRYAEVFPETRLYGKNIRTVAHDSWLRNSEIFEVVGHKGYYRGTGVGGAITGMGANCLTAETRIKTEVGNITALHLFMLQYRPRVWAFDHKTNQPVLRRIVAAKESFSNEIYEIVTVSGRRIRATAEHRFYIPGQGYKSAALLSKGDRFRAIAFQQNLSSMRQGKRGRKPGIDVPRMLPTASIGKGSLGLRSLREGIRSSAVCSRKGIEAGMAGRVLFSSLLQCTPSDCKCQTMLAMRSTNAGDASCSVLFPGMQDGSKGGAAIKEDVEGSDLPLVRDRVYSAIKPAPILFPQLCGRRPFGTDARQGQFPLQNRDKLCQVVCGNAPVNTRAGRSLLRCLWPSGRSNRYRMEGARSKPVQSGYPSYQRIANRQHAGKFSCTLQDLPRDTPQIREDAVSLVRRLRSGSVPVYDFQVEEDHNFFAEDILTHNCLIIDDPIKNRKEADSVTFRQAVEEWYTSTFYTRRAPNASILLTVTRWHEDDLAGRLLEKARSDPKAEQWTVLKLPAIAEQPIAAYDPRSEGEPLWPDRFDLGDLERTQITVGSYDWAALYQQRPAPATGGILKRHWWKYWKPRGAALPPVIVSLGDGKTIEIEAVELPSNFDDWLQSWDCTFKDTKTSDFVAGQVWAKKGADKFLLDYKNERLDIIGTMAAIVDWTLRWPDAIAKLIEDKANGPAVIQMLRHKIAGLIPVEPDGGKVSRAYAAAPEVEAGNVYLPHPALYGWVEGFVGNAAAFPNAAHDDDIDAFTQAMNRWRSGGQTAFAPAQVTSTATIDRLFG